MKRPRFAMAIACVALALAACACAQALGFDSDASELSDFCNCSQLSGAQTQCAALSATKQNDVEFLTQFAGAGCTECGKVPSCYALLGAAVDSATCAAAGDCASLACCNDHGASVCCSACRKCSDPATSPSPHCTGLFESMRACLVTHLAACPECPANGPDAFGDACFTCLAGNAAECNQARFACQNEN